MNFSSNEESHQDPAYLQPFFEGWEMQRTSEVLYEVLIPTWEKNSQTAVTKDESWVKCLGGGRREKREMHPSMSFDQLLLP